MNTGTLEHHNTEYVQAVLSEHKADAALVSYLPDIQWATGFSGSNGLLCIESEIAILITDGRYETQAAREVAGADVRTTRDNLFVFLDEENILPRRGRILLQADHLTLAQSERLKEAFPDVEWVALEKWMAPLRAPKDDEALRAIRQAQRITEEVFADLLEIIRPGMTEKELAAEIAYQHLRKGADKMAFEPIVASGRNASLPHAGPSNAPIQANELLLIDMGCVWNGYASDMTRTVAVGRPSDEAKAVYNVVNEALLRALDTARSGLSTKELDASARNVIDKADYGDYFSHSLGHGVGLETHEWPRISHNTDDVLPEGAVVTLEPGIYLPEKFGVRIEDMVRLHADGCDNLTSAPKDLIQL